jgi:Glucose / Sorbosone dehydrogenase/Cytochrome c
MQRLPRSSPERFPLPFPVLVAALFGSAVRLWSAEAGHPTADPLQEWSVPEGYSLKIVATGFSFPTAIAIIPDPKPDSGSPKMFVTELRGAIKAVANDWTVREFTKVETFKPAIEWPDAAGEGGMAGLCLAPEQGYVFVTYTHRDKYGVLRNGLSRFTTTPRTFEGPAADRRDYLELFEKDSSAFSHQIGACVVSGDSLYVSVGDGGDPAATRSLDKTLGKLLRLTLDGKPYPGNPFASSGGTAAAVYAYGLRNPFGLQIVDGRVFSAENGIRIDRFLEIREGTDYGWDGTDASIATNAAAVFSPTICPVHVAYEPKDQGPLKPSPHARFLIAVSQEEAAENRPGVMSLEFDLARNMVVSTPTYLLRFEGESRGQGIVGLALSPEGLFMAPIMPVGPTAVLMMMRYDPSQAHSRIIGQGAGPAALITTFGCLKCHLLNGTGGSQGPALDKNSLTTRVESRVLDPSYAELIARLEAIPDDTIRSTSPARKEVLSASSKDEKVRLWIVNRLLYPRFDAPNAQMPQMNMTREQAESITAYLLKKSPPRPRSPFDRVGGRRFVAGIGLGMLAGLGLAAVLGFRLRRRSARASGAAGR